MHDDAIVKIKVEESNNKISYGTGYRINHTHVLTALHVLADGDGKTCFTFYFPECEEPVTAYDIDYSNIDYDIALITFHADVLALLNKVPTVEITAVNPNTKWYGCGYPKFAEKENDTDRDLEQIKGGVYYSLQSDVFFQVDCDKQAEINMWGGISGAPLFDRTSNKLIGVTKAIKTNITNIHFNISAIAKLLATDKDFLAYFTKKDSQKRIHHLSQCLIDDLKLNTTFAKFGHTSEQVVDHLAAQVLPDMLDSLEKVKKKPSNKAYRQSIEQFALQLLPHYFADQAVVIDEALVNACEGAIDLKCVSDIAAECSMASLGGRSAEFERVVGQGGAMDYLSVTATFAIAPESGIAQEKEDINAVTHQVLSTAALDTKLQQRFAQGAANPEDVVNTTLAYYKKKKGHRYYLVVRLDKNIADYPQKTKKLVSYKKKYPDLIIINLSTDSTLENVEKMHLELPLIDLLE